MTNVLMFVSDEHNPRYSAAYGHDVVRTPQMERLAERGTVYDSAYCPSPLCVPSRTSLMTGRLPHETKAYSNSKVIERRHPSYGGVLADQGVHTAYVGGGSNLYRDPYALGFTQMVGVQRTGKPLSARSIRAEAAPDPVVTAPRGPVEARYAQCEAQIDRAVGWLQQVAPTLDTPWTLTVEVNPPHPPHTTDPEQWEAYRGLGGLPEFGVEQASAQHPYTQDIRAVGGWDYPEEVVRELRQGYFGAITYVDTELGRLLDAVDTAGLADDTVVCYTSDHGEMLGTFGLWGKTSLYEDSIRVPLIAAGPGFTPGTRVRTAVSTLDLQASIFHAVGARRPAHWHGRALQEVRADDPQRTVVVSYHGHNVRAGGHAVRRGEWKLVYNVAAPHQLFNLRSDPNELVNLWAQRPDIVQELQAELRAICDPEEVERDAQEVRGRQVDQLRLLQERCSPGATMAPWDEAPVEGC